jgi:hypothetical protein
MLRQAVQPPPHYAAKEFSHEQYRILEYNDARLEHQ